MSPPLPAARAHGNVQVLDADRTWAERVRAGDAGAYEAVFRALFQPLVGYIVRIVDSDAIAEELVQELFLTLWLRRSTLEVTGGSLTGYLFASAKNRALAYLRHEKVVGRWRDGEEATAKIVSQERAAERDAGTEGEEVAIHLAIAEAVAALPERCRQVFRMSRERALTYGQIARELGISQKTVEAHMALALRTLRARLQRYL